jgi:hypothetical protein
MPLLIPNALYRLAAPRTQGQGSTAIQSFAYTYDPVGNMTNITNVASTTNSGTVATDRDRPAGRQGYWWLRRPSGARRLLKSVLAVILAVSSMKLLNSH